MAESTLRPRRLASIAEIEALLTTNQVRLRFGLRPVLLLGLLAALVGLFILSLTLGSVDIPLKDILKVMTGGEASKLAWTKIIQNFRLPKALTASLAGAALAVSGLQMQTFFRNPLAGPFVLGISSGASLGVAVVVLSSSVAAVGGTMLASVTSAGPFTMAVAASLGAGLVMLMVIGVARHVEGNMTLLILGLMFSYLTSAIVTLLLYFSITEQIQAYINWTFGSFSGVTWLKLKVFAPAILIGLGIAFFQAKSLNALLLGEGYARTMGLNVQRARLGILLSTAFLAGTVTAFCGPIAFLGLAVPHLCRSLFNTSDHRILIPASILMGAIVALIAALIAEMPGSHITLPLNAVTSFVGAPVVIWVVMRRRNIQKSFGV